MKNIKQVNDWFVKNKFVGSTDVVRGYLYGKWGYESFNRRTNRHALYMRSCDINICKKYGYEVSYINNFIKWFES